MRLITKTTLLYLLITALVIASSGIVLYTITNNFIEKRIRDYFLRKEERLTGYLSNPNVDLNDINSYKSQRVDLLPDLKTPLLKNYDRDTILFNEMEGERQPFRARSLDKVVNGKLYRISMYMALKESRLLLGGIITSLFYVFLALLALMLLLNYLSSRYLWQPFNHTLEQIKHYSLNRGTTLAEVPTTTKEFKELNSLFAQMTSRIEHDFRNMKEFTENISHEIQTPLAIIKAKVEMLQKSEKLTSEQAKTAGAIYRATSHLSKLSRTLGLISKIENQEFTNHERLELRSFLEPLLFNFKELAELKQVKIDFSAPEEAYITIDPYLLEVLLSNLVKNALSHNHEKGEISVRLQPQQLTICNTGAPLDFPECEIFDRFRRTGQNASSLGLGLAIVKKICSLNNLDISYRYQEPLHCFILKF
ncbi:HAMP domain-containing histidine kinase [Adhaeribacter swui]|uniref:histidine kinase n=1 Tax=Adhaeribacter swui TaxID=2086471 RepID=A0A7G7G5Y0_9BACT|nr:HAMP domain-containing sensor histidine kinase [Adhaeribacter swui]QNF32564.1 HAMP domain-containing histidine kinase [Adhaeribacter swui]